MNIKALTVAWQRYEELFGEPPHGTEQQIAALLELLPPPNADELRKALIDIVRHATFERLSDKDSKDAEAKVVALANRLEEAERDVQTITSDYQEASTALNILAEEVESLRAFKRSVDDALNSGDGVYRP